VALRRDVFIGADDGEARAVKDQAVAAGYRGFPPEAMITGTVEQVAEQLVPFAALGVTDILCRHLTNDQSLVLASMERLAEVRRLVAQL
jgi:alkanesulfonate monooxygenase SsuD/methylene tetrahydromethanopterin reductase-like flavin-dependent oxidoreductase (luciferase family)